VEEDAVAPSSGDGSVAGPSSGRVVVRTGAWRSSFGPRFGPGVPRGRCSRGRRSGEVSEPLRTVRYGVTSSRSTVS
jgi:hypothetical protein